MVAIKPTDDNSLVSRCETEKLGRAQGTKIPIYRFGTQFITGNSLFEGFSEEQSLLDSLLLALWEEKMWKGHFKYDVTASEIKAIRGRYKFLAQLSGQWSMNCSQDDEKHKLSHKEDLLVLDLNNRCEDILFCIANSDKAEHELVTSASIPNGSFLIIVNVNPIEYGHVFLVPHGFDGPCQIMDGRSLEMVARVAIEMNNCTFRMFYDSPGSSTSHLFFQACYFPDLLPVERMPVKNLYDDGHGGICISTVVDYPIKNLVFESNCNLKILLQVLAETCSFLLEKETMYNLMISDQGKKIFLFLQHPHVQTLPATSVLTAWECAGYFSFRSMPEFDQVTESILLKRLTTVSLDDEAFTAVKQVCCCIATKFAA
ncbi:GDP-L-galactose phosphorylase 1-like [Mercurialis annua]|uniref:GDP-L-galactose phosphorylase 1-like n=1 Tax=Mercurialis annua TaxID=3986 RepID=UPI00215F30F9|nr:GDP-L-galactose phosphorylase 1-like [Mercurialis annua]